MSSKLNHHFKHRALASALSLSLLLGSAGAQTALPSQIQTRPAAQNTAANQLPVAVQGETAVKDSVTQTVALPFQLSGDQTAAAQAQGRRLILAQTLPQGVRLSTGSSRMDGKLLPDPLQTTDASGRTVLYWALAPQSSGTLTFDLVVQSTLPDLPSPALAWATDSGSLTPLQGKITAADYLLARPAPATGENPGHIKAPLNGSEYRTTNQATIRIEGPLSQPLEAQLNGQPLPADRIGTITEDRGRNIQQLEYFGIPLQPGRNIITLGNEKVEVFVVGQLHHIEVLPVQTVADGRTPIRVRVRALDADGRGIAAPNLTVSSNLEPVTPDADPTTSGYQIRLQGGEGILELRPQALPQRLELEVAGEEGHVWQKTVDIVASREEVGVGVVSATIGINSQPFQGSSIQARASYEGPVGEGKLYVAADSSGLPQTPGTRENNERFGIYGDLSTESVPLRANGPIAALYEHPGFRTAYRYGNLPNAVLPVGAAITAATLQTKSNPEWSAFVAGLPSQSVQNQRLELDGTRLLHLPQGNIAAGSLSLTLVTTDALTGADLRRRSLQEGTEWVLDAVSGTVMLVRPLQPTDTDLNHQYVLASYRLSDVAAGYSLAAGVQAVQRGQTEVAGRKGQYGVGAGAAYMDEQLTFGVRGTYQDAQLEGQARLLVSDGVLGEWTVRSRSALRYNTFGKGAFQNNSFNLRYQSEGYSGLGWGATGLNARGRYELPVNDRFGVAFSGEYLTRSVSKSAVNDDTDTAGNGYIETLGLYRQAPWTFGVGARYTFGERNGFGVTGSAAYRDEHINTEIKHLQPFTGNALPQTELGLTYRVAQNVTLTARDRYTWGEGHLGSVALRNQVGNNNLEIGYEAGEQSSRARLGSGTRWTLNEHTSVGLQGSVIHQMESGENVLSVSSDVRHQRDSYQASAGADLKYSDLSGTSTVLRGAVSGNLNPQLALNAEATTEFGARTGLKLGAGYAYRAAPLSSLGYLRYASGSLGGQRPQAAAGLAAEYRIDPWRVRGGIDGRVLLNDWNSLTYQPYAGLQYQAADHIMLGGWARALIQPSSNTTLFGYGLEGGYRVLDHTWLTVGYNPQGFDGLDTAGLYTRQGAYVRLDFTLDETRKNIGHQKTEVKDED